MSDGVKFYRYVHHLVLEAFVGPRADEMETRHLDSEPMHNCVRNLAWGTREQNVADRVKRAIRLERHTQCAYGHRLVAPNLTPWQLEHKNARKCLACSRAQAHIFNRSKAGKPVEDMQTVSDRYYAEIMAAELVSA